MPSAWTDAHCHLTDPRLEGDLDELLKRAREKKIARWVLGGYGPEDWARQAALKASIPVRTAFGLHPWWVSQQTEASLLEALERLEQAVPAADALGELGIDRSPRFLTDPAQALQRRAFAAQLDIAERRRKPLILHVVRAHEQALQTLEARGWSGRGIVHSFSGDLGTAGRYLKLGFLLSISGAVAKGHAALHQALAKLPPEALVVETDSPDQLPEGAAPWKDGLNEPARLLDVARLVAGMRGETMEALLDRSTANLDRLFGETT